MGRSFRQRVRDETLCDENAHDENARDENVCDKNTCGESGRDEANNGWKFSAGVICGSVRRGKWNFQSYANPYPDAAGQLLACELERDLRVLDERHG
jgi:hypothetical protein